MNSIDEQAQIHWYDHRFYTNQPMPPMPEELTIEAYPEELQGYYFVQFEGLVSRDMRENVIEAGGELLEYVPNNTYVARMDEATRSRIQALPCVQWVGIYQPAMRLSSRVFSRSSGEEPEVQKPPSPLVLKNPRPVTEDPSPPVLTVQVFRGEDLQAIQQAVGEAGGEILATKEGKRRHMLRVRIVEERIYELARINGVMRIEEYAAPQLLNDTGRGVMNVAPVWDWETHGLRGSGQIVGIVDKGLDKGIHVDEQSMHPDLRGRILNIFPWGDAETADYIGHGTHVAGSAVGDGTASGGKYAGAAPEASLVFQALGPRVHSPYEILYDLFEQSYNAGARIYGLSLGLNGWPYFASYEYGCYPVDEFVWDHPDMLILCAAGDWVDENALGSLRAPAMAKNTLTVGASENNRPEITQAYRRSQNLQLPHGTDIRQDRKADNPSGMAAFSCRGPATDGLRFGRVKPDVVAPGTLVVSLRSQALPYKIHFEDDFESDEGGNWTAGKHWKRVPGVAHSGNYCWHYNRDDNNTTEDDKYLTSPEIDPSEGTTGWECKFWCRYDLPNKGDRCQVEVRFGGSTWRPWRSFSGTQPNWQMFIVAGKPTKNPIQVRFSVEAGAENVTGQSVFIDDVSIVEGVIGEGQLSDYGLALKDSPEDQKYVLMSGTSMATGLTSGAAALVREYYTEVRGLKKPSAALLRATLINGAREMYPGQYGPGVEMGEKPNNHEGWGRVDVQNSLFPPRPARLDFVDERRGLEHEESREFYLWVTDDSVPVVVTLVYHDYPGFGLWNQLHLTLTPPGGGEPIHPNGLGRPDVDNNVQQVVIQEPEVGDYLIRVEGASVQKGPQPFALVTSVAGKIYLDPASPILSVKPRVLDFGDVAVNYLSREQIRIYNAGRQALDVKLVDVGTDEEFFIRVPGGHTGMTLAPKEKRHIGVEFLPSEVEVYRGELTFESNDPEKPQVKIDLHGRGMPWLWAQPERLEGYISLNEWDTFTADIWNIANIILPSDMPYLGESVPPLIREKPRIIGDLFPSEPESTFAFYIDQVSVDVQEAQAEFKVMTSPKVSFLLPPRERFKLEVLARPTASGVQKASVEILCVWKPEEYTPFPSWLPHPFPAEEVTWLFKIPIIVTGV